MTTQIIGHKSQLEKLKKALSARRLPNAYLFSGPRGVGKRLVADILIQAVACEKSEKNGWNPCGECPGCKKSSSRNHPDQFIIEPDGEHVKIEQIRSLQSDLLFHPLESPSKIAIIDDADRMTEAASNSMLKLLEEPPPNTHIILISSMPHRLLPTIRSRCQTIAFMPISVEEVAGHLSAKNSLSNEKAIRIARLSGGSLGLALTMDSDLIDEILNRLLAITKKASSADIIETANSWANEGPEHTVLVLDILAGWYADVLRYKATGSMASVMHPEAPMASQNMPMGKAERNLAKISKARASLEGNVNKQLMFEQLLFSLTD